MTNTEKIKAAIAFARSQDKSETVNANITTTVIITGNSLLETMECYYGTEITKGVIIGKASFFNQIVLLMGFHYNSKEMVELNIDVVGLCKEALEQNGGVELA